jgi:hypothetical protein
LVLGITVDKFMCWLKATHVDALIITEISLPWKYYDTLRTNEVVYMFTNAISDQAPPLSPASICTPRCAPIAITTLRSPDLQISLSGQGPTAEVKSRSPQGSGVLNVYQRERKESKKVDVKHQEDRGGVLPLRETLGDQWWLLIRSSRSGLTLARD